MTRVPRSSGGAPFKVVMMGDSGVGKTSIVLQLTERVFHARTKATIAAGCVSKEIQTSAGAASLTV